MDWQASLQKLKEGNLRFRQSRLSLKERATPSRLQELARKGQKPHTTVLCCSDSRIPPEVLFDQGVGDLFVIRAAGNVAEESQTASIEFAASVLGTPLCIIMGHSQCGAVSTTLEHLKKPLPLPSPSLSHLVSLIAPALGDDYEHLPLNELVRRHTSHVRASLLNKSPLLRRLCEEKKLVLKEAHVDMEKAEVLFYDEISS